MATPFEDARREGGTEWTRVVDPSLGSGDAQKTPGIPNTAAAGPKQKDPVHAPLTSKQSAQLTPAPGSVDLGGNMQMKAEEATLAEEPKPLPGAAPPSDDVLRALSSLDDRLVEALERGDIRLLRSAWVDQQPDTYRLQFRQELEKLPDALLPPKEAVALVRRRNRGAGALTYGARGTSNPPPPGLCIV